MNESGSLQSMVRPLTMKIAVSQSAEFIINER
jgi:hypothetical protein